jgi:hypothetical protein
LDRPPFLDRRPSGALDRVVDVRREWALLLAGALFGLALLAMVRAWWRAASARWRMRARMRRAAAGERAAEPLLARAGYRVVGRQVSAALEYAIDGEPCAFEVRADYLVERDGRAWIAEVKTGEHAPRLSTRATRRQLLEYGHAFGAAGVLLVDPERDRVHRVSLPTRASDRPPRSGLAMFALGLAVGAALSALVLSRV